MSSKVDHIVIVTDPDALREAHPRLFSATLMKSGDLACLHCGDHYNVGYPVSFEMMEAIINCYKRMHRNCKLNDGKDDTHDDRDSDFSDAGRQP